MFPFFIAVLARYIRQTEDPFYGNLVQRGPTKGPLYGVLLKRGSSVGSSLIISSIFVTRDLIIGRNRWRNNSCFTFLHEIYQSLRGLSWPFKGKYLDCMHVKHFLKHILQSLSVYNISLYTTKIFFLNILYFNANTNRRKIRILCAQTRAHWIHLIPLLLYPSMW